MLQTRVIPVLLLKKNGLYKTVKFKNPTYIGDPINAVKIFNEKDVDELAILDIAATSNSNEINYKLIKELASECFMPLSYGGNINNIEQIKKLFEIGIEKVILNSHIHNNLELITEASELYGSQSIVVSIDVKKNFFGKHEIYTHSGKKKIKTDLIEFIKTVEEKKAGEIIINSIDLDGVMKGYDIDLMKKIVDSVNIPVVAVGGAGNIEHIQELVKKTKVSAAAAGSIFVYYGKHKAVLINYPTQKELKKYLT